MPTGMRRWLAGTVLAVLVWSAAATAWAQSPTDRATGSETKSVSDADADSDAGSRAGTGVDTDSESDSESDTGTDTDSDTDTGAGSDTDSDSDTDIGTDTDTGTDAESDADPGTDAAPGPESDAESGAETAPAPVDPLAHREREIEEAISRVSLQQRDHSTLLPWLLLGSGIAAVAVSGGYGVGHVLLCESRCGIEFWPPWVLMGGLAMITGGTVWLQSARADREAIDSRRYHLEQQLQRLRWEQGRAERSPRGAVAGLRF